MTNLTVENTPVTLQVIHKFSYDNFESLVRKIAKKNVPNEMLKSNIYGNFLF